MSTLSTFTLQSFALAAFAISLLLPIPGKAQSAQPPEIVSAQYTIPFQYNGVGILTGISGQFTTLGFETYWVPTTGGGGMRSPYTESAADLNAVVCGGQYLEVEASWGGGTWGPPGEMGLGCEGESAVSKIAAHYGVINIAESDGGIYATVIGATILASQDETSSGTDINSGLGYQTFMCDGEGQPKNMNMYIEISSSGQAQSYCESALVDGLLP